MVFCRNAIRIFVLNTQDVIQQIQAGNFVGDRDDISAVEVLDILASIAVDE